ncbi:hypothetical protein SLA2020_384510 [Shorea laevis]
MIARRSRCSTPHLGTLHSSFPPIRAFPILLFIPHSSPKSTIFELREFSNNRYQFCVHRWLPLKIRPKPKEDIN